MYTFNESTVNDRCDRLDECTAFDGRAEYNGRIMP